MNTVQIVRADPDTTGVRLRIWVDDDQARHVCVAETRIGVKTLRTWVREIEEEEAVANQPELPYKQ